VLGRTIIQLAVGDRLLETLITFDAEAADLEPERRRGGWSAGGDRSPADKVVERRRAVSGCD
jgi:hypothetical protein